VTGDTFGVPERTRIVLADDNERIRALVRATLVRLEDEFAVVGEARDGEEVLALVDRLDPELLLLDLTMPELDGLSVLQALRRRRAATRVVVHTAHPATSTLALRARALGAIDVVEKDQGPAELCARLRAARDLVI
jgi:two-component system, chemotaxis family, protein-glutamate methylesterase/glutaminase